MDTIYEIAKWSEVFETAESRRYKSLTWVALPIKMNSSGYQSLLDTFGDRSAAIYGAWCALVSFVAQQPTRGLLCSEQGKPTPTSMIARITGFPSTLFDELLEWAKRDDVGWVVVASSESVEKLTRKNAINNNHPGVTQQPNNNHPTTNCEIVELPEPEPEPEPEHKPLQKPDSGSGYFKDVVLSNGESAFRLLTSSDLQNTRKLQEWLAFVSCQPSPLLHESENALLYVLGAAERAIEKGKDPIKLFASIVGKQRWNLVTQDQLDRANDRIKTIYPKRMNGVHHN